MEKKIFHIKFPDGAIYKGDYNPATKDLFSQFGILLKNEELYFSYEDEKIEEIFNNSKKASI